MIYKPVHSFFWWTSFRFEDKKSFSQKLVNFFLKRNRGKEQKGSSEEIGEKFQKKRWLYALLTLIGIGVLGYFIFGFNQPKEIKPLGFYLTNNNSPKIVLVDSSNEQHKINPKELNFTTSRTYLTPNDLVSFILRTEGGKKIQFPVSYYENTTSSKYKVGNTELLINNNNNSQTITVQNCESGNGQANICQNCNNCQNGTCCCCDDATKKAAAKFFNTAIVNRQVYVPFSFWGFIVGLLPVIFFSLLFLLAMRSSIKAQSGQDGILGVGKSSAKKTKTNVTFKDVAGIQEEKQELIEVVDYLKHPQKYVSMGARAPKGLILYGPPGTGKTLLAKAVSGEANVPFFETSGSTFDDMFVGVGAKRVRNLFARAKKNAPCIIFIDEIDAVASKRGSRTIAGAGGGYADQTINQLLSEMDGFNTGKGIVVMAATNRLDSLDEAILRPGRFDRQIQVNLPDIKERTEILKIHAQNKNFSSKVVFEDVARRTPGFSGAQLENVLNEATILAVRHGKNVISDQEVDEAIDRVMAGPAKKSRSMTKEELQITAYHEAGHALSGLYSEGGELVEKITIIPRGKAAGYTLYAPSKQETLMRTKKDLLAMITTALAGRAAEELIFGANNITTGAANDFYKATTIARNMVTELGMSRLGLTQFHPTEGQVNPYIKPYSDLTSKLIDQEVNHILNTQYEVAKGIILAHRQELDLLAECLLLLEVINKQQIDYVHKNLKLPPEALAAKKKTTIN